jgi:GT2 family glycosyltransferase
VILLDCDVKVRDSDFLREVGAPDVDEFYSSREVPWQMKLTGTCIFWKCQWESINGFNENLIDYGQEDYDFYQRLILSGLKERMVLNTKMLHHIPHDDSLRCQFHTDKDINKTYRNNIELSKETWSQFKMMEKQDCVEYKNGFSRNIVV